MLQCFRSTRFNSVLSNSRATQDGHDSCFSLQGGKQDEGRYKHTVALPRTSFGMRANASVREPEIQKSWDENQVFERIVSRNSGRYGVWAAWNNPYLTLDPEYEEEVEDFEEYAKLFIYKANENCDSNDDFAQLYTKKCPE
ncbi:isoleucine--tRNA ligase, chloroplastic/mitochondrial-like isoform X1 [Eucalyptus grandis]|uniref:isoleucine--tRNA ligase, chloroplastic/mitochondrial-like isoform X1 n=1 Tax=Eucalyptus grandis TaxID=71139 RepID=UPI00192EAA86|nr:isoleucine--tRNA ligase, chloroplastic/mitochondrial-like isoform X1 [Eucalyptus grandis]